MFGAFTPRLSGDEARYASQGEAQDILRRARRGQVHADHRLHFDDAGGDLDETQAQSVEPGDAPHRMLRHRHAKSPHQPVGTRVQEQPKLIGRRFGAGGAIGRQMGLPGLDMVFGLAPPAIDVFVEPASVQFCPRRAYYFVCPKSKEKTPNVQALRAWLGEEIQWLDRKFLLMPEAERPIAQADTRVASK